MSHVRVQFLGTGDAFATGGRLHTCIQICAPGSRFLIDCGASAPVSLQKYGVDPNAISTIFVSHLHGDHFAGIPFFLLHAQLVARRTAPLTLAGPAGTRERVLSVLEAMFPGYGGTRWRFPLTAVTLQPGQTTLVNGIQVTAYAMDHPSGAPSLALRLVCAGKIITFSGDTGWHDNYLPAARHADLLITEASSYRQKIPYHLDYLTLQAHLPEIRAKQVIVTHMSRDMLENRDKLACPYATDGLIIDV